MIEQEINSILRDLKKGFVPLLIQNRAESLFSNVEDLFIKKFGQSEVFKYLCVKKSSLGNCALELCFYKNDDWEGVTTEMVDFLKQFLGNQMEILLSNNNLKGNDLKNLMNAVPIELKSSNKEFSFHSTGSNNCGISTDKIKVGSYIKRQGESPGALGGFVKLVNDPNIYLLTNHHVIIKNASNLQQDVFMNNRPIANSYWGINDIFYDIALAKIKTCETQNISFENSDFANIEKPLIGHKISKYGPCGTEDDGFIYSSKAIVRIGSRIYKNQLLIKDIHLNPGESGTIIREKGEKKTSVLGLHFGGDSIIDISNNLYELFKNKTIDAFTDGNNIQHPSIQFDSFINKKP